VIGEEGARTEPPFGLAAPLTTGTSCALSEEAKARRNLIR